MLILEPIKTLSTDSLPQMMMGDFVLLDIMMFMNLLWRTLTLQNLLWSSLNLKQETGKESP
jgi:hypothetical protein